MGCPARRHQRHHRRRTAHEAGGAEFTAEPLIAAYRQVIEQAHLHGASVAGATLTPFGGSSAFTPEGERIRTAVNEWIRTSRAFDAVIDFDRTVRDPNEPSRFRAEADSRICCTRAMPVTG